MFCGVLRNDLKLNGAKYGCGLGQCGACTVHLDGRPAFSCLTPVGAFEGRRIGTIEGLGTFDRPNPVQKVFQDEQAAQCGYCTAGIMRAQALLDRNPNPTDADVRSHMQPNLCRCGAHARILRAVRRASDALSGKEKRPSIHDHRSRSISILYLYLYLSLSRRAFLRSSGIVAAFSLAPPALAQLAGGGEGGPGPAVVALVCPGA